MEADFNESARRDVNNRKPTPDYQNILGLNGWSGQADADPNDGTFSDMYAKASTLSVKGSDE